LQNFHAAKKSANMEQKIKYYKILRALFANDPSLFAEIEKFINFTGNMKESQPSTGTSVQSAAAQSSVKISQKRKFEPDS
jgi:hypothetical protein